jgi:tagatose 1,6-diphosphate aldolase GatY/KbaY
MLGRARVAGRAVAACNVYTLDQAAGVVDAAIVLGDPVIIQVHPGGVGDGLWPLLAGLRVLADHAPIPVGLQLDHCADPAVLEGAIRAGVDAVMADGSTLDLERNARLVASVAGQAAAADVDVEAEMGRLAGGEDGWTVEARAARLTDPSAVPVFLADSGATMLAVSIGNVHGTTSTPPRLDLARLEAIARATSAPLVLHGGSGLDDAQLRAAISLGVSKVNVNTELRTAYRDAIGSADRGDELSHVLERGRLAVRTATLGVMARLGGAGLADDLAGAGPR